MKILKTASYKKAFEIGRYKPEDTIDTSETEGMTSEVYDFEAIKNMIYLQDKYISTQGTSTDPLGGRNYDDPDKEIYLKTMADVERNDPRLRQQFEERENQKLPYGDDDISWQDLGDKW